MKGKFIVIDGIDGSGKKTQTKAIMERFKKEGKKVRTIDFPRYYDNFFGKLIGEYLAGDMGGTVHPKIASVLYAADRFESSKNIKKWLEEGCIVIADRYVTSNQIHQGRKIKSRKERKEFLEWLEKMEYEIFNIPKPDAIIFLDVPSKISEKLLDNKSTLKAKKYAGNTKDLHEADSEHLKMARENALKFVQEGNNWINIECTEKGKLLPIKDVTNKIWEKINES